MVLCSGNWLTSRVGLRSYVDMQNEKCGICHTFGHMPYYVISKTIEPRSHRLKRVVPGSEQATLALKLVAIEIVG